MAKPYLTRPTPHFKKSYIEAMHEYLEEGMHPGWKFELLESRFEEYVDLLLSRKTRPLRGFVPQTDYWLIAEDVYAGDINIRHYLSEPLKRFGGHIGYRIRPKMRRKGYGTMQLALALVAAWKMGLDRVLITCDDDNIGSIKIIESNGGTLQDKVDNNRGVLTRRYWVIKPDQSRKASGDSD